MFAEESTQCVAPPELQRLVDSGESAAAYDSLGVYYAKHHQFQCAIPVFEKALQLEPSLWESHYDLGLAFLNVGRGNDAVTQLQEALTIKPGNTEILMALGSAFERQRQPENAVERYRLVLKGNPDSVPARAAVAKVLMEEGRYNAAVNWLRGSSADEGLQRLLADAYQRNDDPKNAIQTLRLLVATHPSDARAHSDLGTILQRQGDYGGAAEEFHQAMHLDPSDVYATLSYLNAEVVLQQYTAAQPGALELLRQRPKDFSVLYLNGLIERYLEDDADAELHLRQAVAVNPTSYEACYTLGFVLARRGDPAEAAKQLRAALALKPDSTEARFQLARVLRALGLQKDAQDQFSILQEEKQKETRKTLAQNRVTAADQALKTGDTAAAIQLYRDAVDADPGNFQIYYSLALALEKKGDFQLQRKALQHSLELNADFAPAHNQLGYLDMQEGNFTDAEVQFKTSLRIDPQYAEAANNLGVLYGKLGRREEAGKLFLRATEDKPEYAQAFVNLALILASQSKLPEASVAIERALELAPHEPTVLQARKLIGIHSGP